MNQPVFSNTQIFAHRGANREAAENTRLAFDKALLYPIDGMETDVQMSKDQVTVLYHDDETGKLGFAGRHIDDFTLAELESLDFAQYFANGIESESVLTLKEFIKRYRGRCRLQIEIKIGAWESTRHQRLKTRQALELIETSQNGDVFLSSFDLECMIYANQLKPGFPLFYTLEQDQGLYVVESVLEQHPYLAGLCLPIQTLDLSMMRHLRELDKQVLTYTCNSEEDIQKALDLAVDVLITDDIPKALNMRQSWTGKQIS
ncbi:MAG: glycerophosphodiester phosphodiesterase [Gammaproteobacteria bacterium]|nr:glycerophosphodiester phosphodiesterase [Gammaproteobacteria bacterium]